MFSEAFVPAGLEPPTSLVTDRFRLEPLGPEHHQADRAELDTPLAEAVDAWVAADWPWSRVDRCGR